ncbi:MAG TPA: hypothetical protein VF108_10095 [Actinomycetota bacterium]
MSRRQISRRIRARLSGERGFTILETVIAMTIVFASLTALAYTATIAFRYSGYGRDRIQATGLANRIMEDIRGLAYTKITGGIPSTELGADPRIVSCSGEFRFESCAGEEIVSSTFAAGYDAEWLVPHTGTVSVGNLDVTYSTYVTNDDPTATPYRVTVIIAWSSGAIAAAPNNFVRLQSLFWSPDGCVNSTTHPFAAPCQPYFYGQTDVPQARLDVTGQLYDFSIDFDSLAVTLPGISATAQEEQTTELNVGTTLSGLQIVDSAGTESEGSTHTTAHGDSTVETADGTTDGGSTTNPTTYSVERIATGSGTEVGVRATVASGDTEARAVSVDAAGVDPYDCPTTGTAETDLLPCSGGKGKQGGLVTVQVLHTALLSAVGPANLLRIAAPSTDSTASIDRDAAGTNEDGVIDVRAGRTLGTVQLGGFPTSGMTAPAGMSTTATNDSNYCVRLVGYQDSVQAIAGESSSTDPSATITAGTFYYYNGTGFSNKASTDSTLDTLTVTCSKTQVVGLSTVTWRVTVASGGISHTTTTTSETNDPTDGNIRWDAQASTQPIEITVRYEFIVDGVTQINLSATFDPGDLFAHGIYEPPPAVAGV